MKLFPLSTRRGVSPASSSLGFLDTALALTTLGMVSVAAATDSYADAVTRTVEIGGQTIAYREVGSSQGTPLLLLNRFRGTMDHSGLFNAARPDTDAAVLGVTIR